MNSYWEINRIWSPRRNAQLQGWQIMYSSSFYPRYIVAYTQPNQCPRLRPKPASFVLSMQMGLWIRTRWCKKLRMVYLGKWNLKAANQDTLLELLLMIGNSNIMLKHVHIRIMSKAKKETTPPTHPDTSWAETPKFNINKTWTKCLFLFLLKFELMMISPVHFNSRVVRFNQLYLVLRSDFL
jgi:hypothetical protein